MFQLDSGRWTAELHAILGIDVRRPIAPVVAPAAGPGIGCGYGTAVTWPWIGGSRALPHVTWIGHRREIVGHRPLQDRKAGTGQPDLPWRQVMERLPMLLMGTPSMPRTAAFGSGNFEGPRAGPWGDVPGQPRPGRIVLVSLGVRLQPERMVRQTDFQFCISNTTTLWLTFEPAKTPGPTSIPFESRSRHFPRRNPFRSAARKGLK